VSTLVAIAYKDAETARAARAELERLQQQQLIQIDDAVIARNEGGKIQLEQGLSMTGAGAAGGALWGGLFGLIFLMPIAGMAIGAATGAIAGHFSDYGVDDKFAKQLASQVQPGQAALVLLVRSMTADKVVAEMAKYQFGGQLIQSSLSTEDEEKLKAAYLAASPGAAQGSAGQAQTPPAS
jgi:uncharacterized membrane protein